MLGFIKRFFCKHDLTFVRNIYGDEIIMSGYKRSIWKCAKCGALVFKEDLQRDAHQQGGSNA